MEHHAESDGRIIPMLGMTCSHHGNNGKAAYFELDCSLLWADTFHLFVIFSSHLFGTLPKYYYFCRPKTN
jgi:hypothetical protein